MKIKACIFDAFGTLFSLQIPVEKIDFICNGKGAELRAIWRRKQLEYTWLSGLMEAYLPFDKVTGSALSYAMNHLDIEAPELFDILMPIYGKAVAIDTVKPMLKQLKRQDVQTAILSNGTPAMLEAGAANAGIDTLLDVIFSVDAVQTYKPSPRVYQMALDGFGIEKEEVLFLSSNQWDVAGATQFGLPTVWVNQYDETKELLPAGRFEIGSLADLPGLLLTI